MRYPREVSLSQQKKILEEASARRTPIVLSCQNTGGWQTFKSHLLNNPRDNRSIFIAYPYGIKKRAINFSAGQNVGISFRSGHKKFLLNTTISALQVDRLRKGPILKLNQPENMYMLQRRHFDRVRAPEGMAVDIEVWMDHPDDENLDLTPRYHGTIVDLSAGGVSLKLPNEQDPQWEVGDPIFCSFQASSGLTPVNIITQFRYREQVDDYFYRMGLQFVGLEATPEGRQILKDILKLIHQFQDVSVRETAGCL